jgi:hypothetical protein
MVVVDKCPRSVKREPRTHVHIASWTIASMDKRRLAKRRYLSLVAQLTAEKGSLRKACAEIGCDPSYAGRLADNPTQFVGLELITRAETKLRLLPGFFSDPSLGDDPPYVQHRRGSRASAPIWTELVEYLNAHPTFALDDPGILEELHDQAAEHGPLSYRAIDLFVSYRRAIRADRTPRPPVSADRVPRPATTPSGGSRRPKVKRAP